MADLIVYISNHGYADEDPLYISWLDGIRYVSDQQQDSFKLATTAGGSILEEFSETITNGYVREIDDTAGTTTISGLDHLEGEDVCLTASGRNKGLYTVSGGSITIPADVYTYCVGMPYISTGQPMKLDIGSLGLATTKKISSVIVSLYKTLGGQYGPSTNNMTNFSYDDNTNLFTGDKDVPVGGGYEREGNIVIRQADPLPMTVLALTMDVGAYAD
jgi:hypothetical protein